MAPVDDDHGGPVRRRERCASCRTWAEPSETGPGLVACDRRRCKVAAARGNAVIALLAGLRGWVSALDVAAAAPTLNSSWTAGQILRGLDDAGYVQSGDRASRSRHGGRPTRVYRLTRAGRALASTIGDHPGDPDATTTAAPEAGPAAPATTSGRAPLGPAIGYMSSARLSVPQQGRTARLLREQALAYGLDLVDVFVETEPGSREAFDRMTAALAVPDPPTVIVPSWHHLAVDEHRQTAMVAHLEDHGATVIAMDGAQA